MSVNTNVPFGESFLLFFLASSINMQSGMIQIQFGNETSDAASWLHRTAHMASSYMTSQIMQSLPPITLDRIKFETCAKCHFFAMSYRMIFNMAYLSYQVSHVEYWVGLRSDFQLDLSGSKVL